MPELRPVNPVYEQYPQPPSEVFEAWRRTRDPHAGTTIIQNYDPFVSDAAAQCSEGLRNLGGTIDEDDLVQAGRQAVLHHAELFDTAGRRRFLPSAAEDILGAIALVQLQHGSAVYLHGESPKIRDYRAGNDELAKIGEPPLTDREAAKFLGIEASGHAIVPCPTAPWTAPSLHTAVALGAAQSLEQLAEHVPEAYEEAQIIGTVALANTEDQVIVKLLVQNVLDLAFAQSAKDQKNLPIWRDVLELRYGLKGGREHTQEEVAAKLQLSRTRVKQIEKAALLRMKRYVRLPQFEGLRSRRVYFLR